MEKTSISLTKLLRAQKKFEQFRLNLKTEQEKAGAIQAFEYCFELGWRTTKKFLEQEQTTKLVGPRDTIRLAALFSLIDDPEVWFTFLDSRNLTSHIYEENTAEEIVDIFPLFSKELQKLNDTN
jgi:nucleotidyltransferase substrate binding protein (TIGR01987 family)